MKTKQIAAKLEAANIEANILSNKAIEIAELDEDGDVDKEESEAQALRAAEILGWEGFATGWGGWHLRPKK